VSARQVAPAPDDDDGPHFAEQALLGSFLLDVESLGRVAETVGLRATHFVDSGHQGICSAIGDLCRQREPVDPITVSELLKARGQLERCGGLAYVNALAMCVPSAANAEAYARLVVNGAKVRGVREAAQRLQAGLATGQTVAELQGLLDRARVEAEQALQLDAVPARVRFSLVPLLDLQACEEDAQQWWWQGYVPAGHVTLWSGHGGVGKSLLALMLLVSMALGRPFLGKSTKQCRCLFFSAEDPARTVRQRLRRICREWGIEAATLAQHLWVIDATELDAALYVEQRVNGVRHGATTPAHDALRRYIEAEAIDVVVLDNASDVFDGDEIVRAMVRGFIRSLAQLVRQREGGLILLSHVDKGTSRAGKAASRESYSGSTAWHNSSRSLITLLEKEPGLLELQHQKCNLGPKQEPVLLRWPEGALPAMEASELPADGAAQRSAADDMRDLVALIRDYYSRGEWVSPAQNSPKRAARLLANEARYPRGRTDGQVAQLLREAQRAKFIVIEEYPGRDRHPAQRWCVTAAGVAMVEGLPLFVAAETGGTQ
jgi:AAA domain/DnaB-like helicase N terminal domain